MHNTMDLSEFGEIASEIIKARMILAQQRGQLEETRQQLVGEQLKFAQQQSQVEQDIRLLEHEHFLFELDRFKALVASLCPNNLADDVYDSNQPEVEVKSEEVAKVSKNSNAQFECEACGKTFAEKSKFHRHLASHSEERAFQCEHCAKTFKLADHLKRHLKTQHALA